MDGLIRDLVALLQKSATVHIYSFPYFALETFLATVVCIIYVFLHMEISRHFHACNRFKSNRVYAEKQLVKYESEGSFSKSKDLSVYQRSSISVEYPSLEQCLSGGDMLNSGFVDELHGIVQLTPQEYVRQGRELTKSQKRKISLRSLVHNVMTQKKSSEALKNLLDGAKEEAKCTRAKLHYVPRLMEIDSSLVTDSFLDLMVSMVLQTSVQYPLSFKGDITALALDVGNLKNPKFNTKLELPKPDSVGRNEPEFF